MGAECSLEPYVYVKRWTTLGPDSALRLVAARLGGATQTARIPLKLVLVRQGAASFEHWTKIEAPIDVMRAAIRSDAVDSQS